MKKLIALILFLIPLSCFVARNDIAAQTCEQILADARKAANNGAYKDAVLKYLAAQKVCPTTRDQEIKGYVLDVFTKIEALKKKAEDAEKAAKTNLQKAKDAEAKALAEQANTQKALEEVKLAKKQADENLQKAKEEEAKALDEQAKTKRALDEAQAANMRVVASYLKDIDQHILKLEYENALEKCQMALDLKVDNQKDTIQKRLLEIAYFFTETDTLDAAIKTLKLLNINTLPNRNDLLSVIQENAPPQYFTFLEERYYPKMIKVEGGTFQMGGKNEVRVNDFQIAQTETTVWQYFLYLKANHKKPYNTPTWQYSGDNPMIYVSWYDAVEYANWVSQRRGKTEVYDIDKTQKDPNNLNSDDDVKWIVKPKQTNGYRLPTEAEWEFAARGGNKTHGFEYSGDSNLENVAWYDKNSNSRTHSVKTKKENELGLYDMSGNVWEWCNDWYSDNLNISSDKMWTSPLKGANRSLRGGAWGVSNDYSRVSDRVSYYAYSRFNGSGFRFVVGLQDK